MTLKIDFRKFEKKLISISRVLEAKGKQVIKETAEEAIEVIVQRTRRKNTDKDGKKFARYSDGYKRQKARAGASSQVNLTSTGKTRGGRLRGNAQGGAMLNSITTIRIEDRGLKRIISVARPKELKKLIRHVRGNGRLPIRNPLGFTRQEEERLSKRAALQITAFIQKIGRA